MQDTKRKIYISLVLFFSVWVGLTIFSRINSNKNTKLGDKIVYFDRENGNDSTDVEKTPEVTQTPVVSDTPVPTVTPEVSITPEIPTIKAEGKIKYYDTGTAVVGDSGYELYSYVDSAATSYAKAVNKLTKKLDKGVKVYDIIAPTSVGITFPDNKISKLKSSSQESAIKKIEKKLSGRETFISLYDILMEHRDEYIYFRTDHHWTQTGAYYAYSAFCAEKGVTVNPLDSYKVGNFSSYKGTFYRDSNNDKSLKKDKFKAFYPLSKNVTMQYTTSEGTKGKAPVVANAKKYGESMKYLAYIAGDNPFSVIKNKDKKDGTSCIVVKESFGNAFVPFLVDHYETIYVIDYRYWQGNLASFVKKKRAKEVIILNNISMTRNLYLIGKLAQVIS